MRISDWSSDVCSSDLTRSRAASTRSVADKSKARGLALQQKQEQQVRSTRLVALLQHQLLPRYGHKKDKRTNDCVKRTIRSEEHTSELQSLMRTSYAVFCLKKKKQTPNQ